MPPTITPSKILSQLSLGITLAIFFIPSPCIFANQIEWQVNTGDWSIPANWSTGTVPSPSDGALISNGGVATISSGTVSTDGEGLGYNNTGTIDQTGGTNTTNGLFLGSNGTGTYNLSGGSLIAKGIYYAANGEYVGAGFGVQANGTFIQSGGTNTTDILAIGAQSENTGTYTLSGGSLTAGEILLGGNGADFPAGTGTFSISGNAQLNVPNIISVSSGSQFTVNGGTTYAAFMDDATSYIQTAGNATYGTMGTGPATLSGGTLTLIANQPQFPGGPFEVFSGFGPTSISGSATLQVGDRLDITDLNMTGGTIEFGTSSGEISVDNGATLSAGDISFFVTGAPSSSCYTLLTAQSLNSSLTFAPYTVGRMTFTPSVNCNSIIVNVAGSPAALVWNNTAGGNGQTWDTIANANWSSSAVTGGHPNQFYPLDNATFNDNNNGHYSVNIVNSGVQPNSVTVNTAGAYIFSGGPIDGGSGGLNVNGGTLILQNANSWYGVVVDGGTLAISAAGSLTVAGNEYVGNSTIGRFNQSSGTHLIQGALTLGANAGSSGTYNLAGGVITMALAGESYWTDTENVGGSGTGYFIQTGGINNGGDLELGVYPGSLGTYSLSGSGQLYADVTVGAQGQGIFTQSGGAISGDVLEIGEYTGIGDYTLSGNGTMSFDYETLDGNGIAAFYQNGGTNNVRFLFIGPGPSSVTSAFTPVSIYYLSGGSLSALQEEIGGLGTSEFIQTGGSNTVNASPDGVEFDIGQDYGVSGIYSLAGGSLTIYTDANIGGDENNPRGSGTLTVSDRGVLNIVGKLYIYPAGQVDIDGGTVNLSSLSISPGGILNLNDALTINYQSPNQDPISSIRDYLQTGYDNGKWDGTGINSSLAASTPGTGIGYADTGTQIVLQYTWLGDANLDGVVDAADLADISATGTTWATGDFNYDGKVNGDDYSLFMLGEAVSNGARIFVSVPEPSVVLGAGLLLVALFSRGRREKLKTGNL